MALSADYPLVGKRVLLVVTGSIAASRVDEVRRQLRDAGADVQFLLTETGARFFPVQTAATLTDFPVLTESSAWDSPGSMPHITAKQETDLVLVAPATANRVLQANSPQPDDFLGTVLHAYSGPVLYAPAMNPDMWEDRGLQQIVNDNPEKFILPEAGLMACDEEGIGRLAEPERILEHAIRKTWATPLAGQRWVVSAGPTLEPWDDVRVLTNRSSGRMGEAMARMAWRLGADTTLVTSARASFYNSVGLEVIPFESAEDLREIVKTESERADGYVSTAAVADYRPKQVEGKLRSGESPEITLEPVTDILSDLAREFPDLDRIGFAVEPDRENSRAMEKLQEKQLDLLVVNYVSSTNSPFGSNKNRVDLYKPDGSVRNLPERPKSEVALQVWGQFIS